ncbi:hypothetical protein KQH82_13260 [bacterium]|nr:hypothetical protein [bacterium]
MGWIKSHVSILHAVGVALMLVACLTGSTVQAQPAFDSLVNVVQWTSAEGGNDHWYGVFKYRMPFMAADSAVTTMGWNGLPVYLATVTSQEENDFLFSTVLQGPDTVVATNRQLYLGASYSTDWFWLNDEVFSYENWASGEPNNLGTETGIALKALDGKWNNIYAFGTWTNEHQEWSIVEWGAPDSTVPEPELVHLVQWPVAEGGNDHWYGVYAEKIPWSEARVVAAEFTLDTLVGYLASVDSDEENAFIFNSVFDGLDTLGSPFQLYLGALYEDGVWGWLTDEEWTYTNWYPGEPNNVGTETAVAMRFADGMWNNVMPNDLSGPQHREWSLVEFGTPDTSTSPPLDSLINLVQWPVSEGGNDHWYGVFPERVPWETAQQIASTFEVDSLPGYLATVTSLAENNFIATTVLAGLDSLGSPGQLYLGGFYEFVAWTWLTGEAFAYTNWAVGEPNNTGIEVAMAMRFPAGTWNNVMPNDLAGPEHREWSIVEFGSADMTTPDSLVHLVQWPVSEGGNDHWYAVFPQRIPWETAEQVARTFHLDTLTGHLATITSQAENDFIFNNVLDGLDSIGTPGQLYLGGRYYASVWFWLTGEDWAYDNWAAGEPNNVGIEIASAIRYADGYWNNVMPNDITGSIHREWSVIEFAAEDTVITIGDSLYNLIQWPASEGGNDHWYAVYTQRVPWETANQTAPTFLHEGEPGYLATITSPEENQFVFEYVLDGVDSIGTPGQLYLGGSWGTYVWSWLTGEAFHYTHWASGEPNNIGNETALAMRVSDGFWNNVMPNDLTGSIHREWSIIEWGEPDSTVGDTLLNLVQWPAAAGGNDHWYAVLPQTVQFANAHTLAHSLVLGSDSGYLATVTSAEENEFILNNVIAGVVQPQDLNQFYLGGYYTDQWQWLTPEVWSYQNWAFGEPNNIDLEKGLAILAGSGEWNNVRIWDGGDPIHRQWSVVEFGPIQMLPPDSLVNLVEWPVSEGGNGHWYAVNAVTQPWGTARQVAEATVLLGETGHLATVTSLEENQFILQSVIGDLDTPSETDQFYLGGQFSGESWTWLTGEMFGFTNWASSEPSSPWIETAMAMWGGTNTAPNRMPGTWNDVQPTDLNGPVHRQWSILEWDISGVGVAGNINGDIAGETDLADLMYLVNYLFLGGPAPMHMAVANVDGDQVCEVDLSDLLYLVNWLFLGGPTPTGCEPNCVY